MKDIHYIKLSAANRRLTKLIRPRIPHLQNVVTIVTKMKRNKSSSRNGAKKERDSLKEIKNIPKQFVRVIFESTKDRRTYTIYIKHVKNPRDIALKGFKSLNLNIGVFVVRYTECEVRLYIVHETTLICTLIRRDYV